MVPRSITQGGSHVLGFARPVGKGGPASNHVHVHEARNTRLNELVEELGGLDEPDSEPTSFPVGSFKVAAEEADICAQKVINPTNLRRTK